VSAQNAEYVCVCGHAPKDHQGRYYALPTGTCAPSCSLCDCAWLCATELLNDGRDDAPQA